MTGGSNVKAELDALAAQAVASYGASMQSWVSTAFTVKTARSVATHGTWAAFLDSAGITARVAQRMIRIAEIGDTKCYGESYLLAVTALGGAVTALGGIEATLEAQAHSPKKVRELVARHARIAELEASLDTERAEVADLEERDAIMEIAPANAQHFERLAKLQADRRELREKVNGEKVKRAAAEVEVKGIRKAVAKAEAERDRLGARVREAEEAGPAQ